MMKMTVVAANGKAGSKIVEEALSRQLDVAVAVRGSNRTKAQRVLIRDLMDLTAEDLAGSDVVVDAFGASAPDALPQHTTTLMHLVDILAGSPTRLLVVGGAGSLYMDADHTLQLKDTPDFPKGFKPLAQAMGKALDRLRERLDCQWTYVSPAADFRADGPRTGRYLLRGEEFSTNDQGISMISYADYAIGLVDEAVKDGHDHQRISLIGR